MIISCALLTLAFALWSAGPAAAQSSGVDQYTPTAPGAGGPSPQGGPTPQAGSDAEQEPSADVGSEPDPQSGSGSGDESDEGAVGEAPVEPPSGDPLAADAGDESAGADRRGADQRVLDGIAAAAEAERNLPLGAADNAVAARLLREPDGAAGLGPVLWILLVIGAIGAVAVGVHQRRGRGHSPSQYDREVPSAR